MGRPHFRLQDCQCAVVLSTREGFGFTVQIVFVVCVPFRNDMWIEILFKVRASASDSANHNEDPVMATNELDTGSIGTEHTGQVLGLVF